jgi:hypothetical protein
MIVNCGLRFADRPDGRFDALSRVSNSRMRLRVLAVRIAPELCDLPLPLNTEGAGKAGCRLAPAAPVRKKCTGRDHRFSRGGPGPPCANGFNGLYRALPGDEFVLPPSSANWRCCEPGWVNDTFTDLTPATGARTIRLCRPQSSSSTQGSRPCAQTSKYRRRRSFQRRSSARPMITHKTSIEARPAITVSRPTLPRPPHPTARS